MKNKWLKHSIKSYTFIVFVGFIVGIITRLTDFFPNDDIWGFSSIATLLGFWIITTTFIIYKSSSNLNSAINVFLYLFSMTVSFYLSQPILGVWFPLFENPFQTGAFVLFTIGSFLSAIAGFILYYWNKDRWFSNILYALPLGVLAAELIGLVFWFIKNSTWLFQLMMDFAGVIILGVLCYKKANNKIIFIFSLIFTTLISYFSFYHRMI